MTKALAVCFFCITLIATIATAQEYDRAEVFGGYSYLNFDTNSLTSRQSLNGWEGSFSYNINRWLAAEGDVSGYYKGYSYLGASLHVSDYAYVFGPRFNFRPNDFATVFAHALFGGDHLGGSLSGNLFGIPVSGSGSQDSFAMALGGGFQYRVARHVAVRTSVDYFLTRFNIFNPANRYNQNNYRVGAGVVYTFGGGGKEAASGHQPPASPYPAQSQPSSVESGNTTLGEFRLQNLGISGNADASGFRVTGVTSNSKAAQSGITVGDSIIAVDAKTIATNDDLFRALSVSTGKVLMTTRKPGSNQSEQHELVMWTPSK